MATTETATEFVPSDDDKQLIEHIASLLETTFAAFKKEIHIGVHKQLAEFKPTPQETPEKPDAKQPSPDASVKLLQSQLEALQSELKAEKLSKAVTALATKHKLHPDLLQFVLERQGVAEVSGQLVVGKDTPELLENYVSKYATTAEGQRLKTERLSGTTLKDEGTPKVNTESVADALFSLV